MQEFLKEVLRGFGVAGDWVYYLANTGSFVVVVLLSLLVNWVTKHFLVSLLKSVIDKSHSTWDDAVMRRGIIDRLAQLAPAIVIFLLTPYALEGQQTTIEIIRNVVQIYMIFVVVLALDAALEVLVDVYRGRDNTKGIPIRGFVQVAKLVLYFLTGILIISILLDKTPLYLISGLGALTAVLLLIFRDAILGFVAGIQLAANNMVAQGDWIEMPKYGADGDVLEVSLATVKVQNWDKTITTIPTYALISESFKNWRGMEESGGRRIKRAVNIDMSTIRFCDEEMLKRFAKIQYIAEYIEKKKRELEEFNLSTSYMSADRQEEALESVRAGIKVAERHLSLH
ncbi:mechanosensitive ion channel family protein, partial [Pseudomonadota bacterium]